MAAKSAVVEGNGISFCLLAWITRAGGRGIGLEGLSGGKALVDCTGSEVESRK